MRAITTSGVPRVCWAVALASLFLLPPPVRAGEQQVWLNLGLRTELSPTWTCDLNEEIRLVEKTREVGTYFTEVRFTSETGPHLGLGVGYRRQMEEVDGDWLQEDRLILHATPRWSWGRLQCSDRNQLEGRAREKRSDHVRYRNKLMVAGTSAWSDWRITPYAAGEVFYDNESSAFLRSRFYLGLQGRPAAWLRGDLFAIWESTETSSTQRQDVMIAGVKLVVLYGGSRPTEQAPRRPGAPEPE